MIRSLRTKGPVLALWLFSLAATLYPFYWFLALSLKRPSDAFANPPVFLFAPTFEHYRELAQSDFLRFFFNSFVIALGTVVLSLTLGVPAAYAMARWRFRGRRFVLAWILFVRMLPGMTYVIPFFVAYQTLGLLDTHISLIILYTIFNLTLTVWVMGAFFQEVPRSLEEAAYVDGATVWQSFRYVVLPVSKAGIATISILTFLFSWNEFTFALIISRRIARTAPVAILNFLAFEGAAWGQLAAGAVLLLAPVLLFGFVVRRYIVSGLLAGGVKG